MSDLNRVVEVSIFVDGEKAVQTECNEHRPDLQAEGFGAGRHGFWYDFPEKLDDGRSRSITVRFSDSGAVLEGGAVSLKSGKATRLPVIDEEDALQAMRLPPPRTPRELLQLLALADPRYEAYDFFRRIDYSTSTVQDVHRAVFGSVRRENDQEAADSRACVRDYIYDSIFSDDFQRLLIQWVLEALSEKRRLLFVHIPKCAGSNLSRHLRTRYPSLDQRITESVWTTKVEMFDQLREFAMVSGMSDRVFLRGHINLDFYIKNNLYREGDMLFTVVRDPIEIALSQSNYVVTRMREDSLLNRTQPDTADWLTILGMSEVPSELTQPLAESLCRSVLRNQNIVIPNPLCHWLGGGSPKEVLQRLADSRVEITDTTRYQRWLHDRWRIESSTRSNESIKYLSASNLSSEDLKYLQTMCSDDREVFDVLKRELDLSSNSWIGGY